MTSNLSLLLLLCVLLAAAAAADPHSDDDDVDVQQLKDEIRRGSYNLADDTLGGPTAPPGKKRVPTCGKKCKTRKTKKVGVCKKKCDKNVKPIAKCQGGCYCCPKPKKKSWWPWG